MARSLTSKRTTGSGNVRPMKIRAPKKSVASAYVLTIGDEGAVLAYFKKGVTERRLFAAKPDAASIATMTELLALAPSTPIYLLLDVMDQHYMRQTFPPVSAMSLKKIVQRRLDRELPPDDIKDAFLLGRDMAARKEWLYLLLAITPSAELQSWLEWVLEQNNSFKGLFLVPLESSRFMARLSREFSLAADVSWHILLMHTKVGGLRQVVIHEGKIIFTRITQVTDENNHAYLAGSVEQEIQNTLDYLRRFDFENNQIAKLSVIVGGEIKSQLDVTRFRFAGAQVFTPHEAAEALGLEQAALYEDQYSDIVFAHAFLSDKPLKSIMPTSALKVQGLERGIQAAKMLACAVVGICALLSLGSLISYVGQSGEMERVATERKAADLQFDQLKKLTDNQVESEKIAASVVALLDQAKLGVFSPLDVVKELAPLLKDDARVTSFEWRRIKPEANAPQIQGPADVEINFRLEFTGMYADDVVYANAAVAQSDTIMKGLSRYQVEVQGLPGAQGQGQLEIDFDAEKLKNAQAKKRELQFKLRGLLPPPATAGGA